MIAVGESISTRGLLNTKQSTIMKVIYVKNTDLRGGRGSCEAFFYLCVVFEIFHSYQDCTPFFHVKDVID